LTELKNVRIPFIISLSLQKGNVRIGFKELINKELIPTLLLKIEGLMGRINIKIIILTIDYRIKT
jgi:hypothetical protein